MLEDPGLDTGVLANALRAAYGIHASALAFVPGYDARAASYEVVTDEARFFLKVRFGAVHEASLELPTALLDAGVRNVLAPIRARSSALWTSMVSGRSSWARSCEGAHSTASSATPTSTPPTSSSATTDGST